MFRDSPSNLPRDCVAMVPDTLGIHGQDIGRETGKRPIGPYKPRISYQVMGKDRGDRETGRRAGQGGTGRDNAPRTTGRGTGGQRDGDSQPAIPTATSESAISAQTPTPPVSSPPFA